MGPVKMLALAGAATLVSTAVLAADLPPAPPLYATPVETSGWYLRGDVGVGAQRFKSFDFHQTNAASGFGRRAGKSTRRTSRTPCSLAAVSDMRGIAGSALT